MSDFHRFGLGTYQLEDEQCVTSVQTSLDAGYRHLDTAQSYENESHVAAGIDASGVDRDEVFIATKLSTRNLGYRDAIETARASADRLGVDTIDLLYVHWPIRTYDVDETARALNQLVAEGVVDHVGMSNFRPDQLDAMGDRLEVPIFAHQVECHPLLQQEELRMYARDHNHWLVAYCPIARNRVADVPVIQAIADEYDATPAQISIAWLLAKDNVAAIPKATSGEHIRQNIAATEIDLAPDDVARIDDISDRHRIVDFDEAPWNTPTAGD